LGLADLFSKEARARNNLKKTIARAADKHAQSGDRFRALEQLRDDGSPQAIAGLLRRFSFVYDKSIEDEQEKEWVYQSLVEMGSKVVTELRRYMHESDTLSWSLKVLEHVARGEAFYETLRTLCEENDNSYVRDPSKKIQLVHFMGEHRDPKIAELVVPYVEDVDEGVRFKAVEALLHQGQREVILAPLLSRLLNKAEESRRIKVRILEGLSEAGVPINERTSEVERALDDLGLDGKLDAQKRLKLGPTARA
jgi:hypothetical protein